IAPGSAASLPMPPDVPSPLRPDTPLACVFRLVRPAEALGAWVRTIGSPVKLRGTGVCCRRALLLSGDLGFLLRRTGRVAVRHGDRVVVAPVEQLIGWRALRIVLGAPYLPPPQLQLLFPELRVKGPIISLPIGLGSPEEVLAIFAAEGIPVAATQIEYLPH
ncbi:MAG: hypothetical protein ACRDJK_13230, partial [Actinomycetota bacterium]